MKKIYNQVVTEKIEIQEINIIIDKLEREKESSILHNTHKFKHPLLLLTL